MNHLKNVHIVIAITIYPRAEWVKILGEIHLLEISSIILGRKPSAM